MCCLLPSRNLDVKCCCSGAALRAFYVLVRVLPASILLGQGANACRTLRLLSYFVFGPTAQVMLAGEQMEEGLQLGGIADRTDGFSGSDLRHLCTAAAMRPLRELLTTSGKTKSKVTCKALH